MGQDKKVTDFDSYQNINKNVKTNNLVPQRSKALYEKAYSLFKDWCHAKKIDTITEDVILAYLEDKSKKVSPPTLWSTFSMLKTTLIVKENMHFKKSSKVFQYLKNKNTGHHRNNSKVFTMEDIENFLNKADDKYYLLMKVKFSKSIG